MSQSKATDQIKKSIASPKKSFNKFFILGGIVLVAAVALILCYILFWANAKEYNQVVTDDNIEEVIAQMDETERTPIGSYEVTMNTTWQFKDASSVSSNAYVENGKSNRNTVQLTMTPENDTKNIVYTSPKIPVGGKLEKIKLDKSMGKGTHNMLVKYHLLDNDDNETRSVTVKVKLTIQN